MPEELKDKSENIELTELREFSELLKHNLDRSEEILKISRDLKKYLRLQNIWSITRILIIVIPLVLGFIYLPPLLKDAFQSYRSLLQ